MRVACGVEISVSDVGPVGWGARGRTGAVFRGILANGYSTVVGHV